MLRDKGFFGRHRNFEGAKIKNDCIVKTDVY